MLTRILKQLRLIGIKRTSRAPCETLTSPRGTQTVSNRGEAPPTNTRSVCRPAHNAASPLSGSWCTTGGGPTKLLHADGISTYTLSQATSASACGNGLATVSIHASKQHRSRCCQLHFMYCSSMRPARPPMEQGRACELVGRHGSQPFVPRRHSRPLLGRTHLGPVGPHSCRTSRHVVYSSQHDASFSLRQR